MVSCDFINELWFEATSTKFTTSKNLKFKKNNAWLVYIKNRQIRSNETHESDLPMFDACFHWLRFVWKNSFHSGKPLDFQLCFSSEVFFIFYKEMSNFSSLLAKRSILFANCVAKRHNFRTYATRKLFILILFQLEPVLI